MIDPHALIQAAFPAFKGQELRHVVAEGAAWLMSPDACRILGMDLTAGTAQWLKGLDPDEKRLITRKDHPEIFIGRSGQSMMAVSEPGLYKLIARSNKPEAKEFDRWVRHEVLPRIRQTGGYLLNEEARPTAYADTLSSLPIMETITNALTLAQGEIERLGRVTVEQAKEIVVQAETIAEAAPKVESFERLMDADGAESLRIVAKNLGIPEKKFVTALLAGGYCYRHGGPKGKLLPLAQHQKAGLFVVIAKEANGFVRDQMCITPLGRDRLSKRFARLI